MCATKMNSQELASALNNENKATSTIVAVVPSNVTENAMTILSRKLSGIPTIETPESQEFIDASDLTRDQWIQVLGASSVLKAWKRRSEGDTIHVNRAPCAALSLKSRSADDHNGTQGLPEFEIADDTYVDSRESKSRLERELTLKAFSENGIRAGLSGGAPDVGFGLSGAVSWQKEGSDLDQQQTSNRAIHGFYNFPRVILHLDPDYLDLSPQCKQFLKRYGQDCLDPNKISDIYKTFTDRFGSILPARVTLGARLCTTQELNTDNISNIAEARKTLETDLTTKVIAASAGIQSGYHRKTGSSAVENMNQTAESSRMTLETQGGNGLLASSIPDWTASVASHRYWRTIQQEKYWDLPTFLRELAQDGTTWEYFDALANHVIAEKKQTRKTTD
ncbi:hypothetical protein GJ744_008787 [Endocarpon pusillum]|uniref:MACPF-like domain-containing protein n=1 Tax=Endocarpon pusillum TaxID=364733 RepID=A0A8H7E9R5_9EURO|nr:hypothetical protein GJ744_008787 [Endocarpon pusillum]